MSDQYVSDVYFGAVESAGTVFSNTAAYTDAEYVTRLMFNSYTVSLSTIWANLHISYSLFWTGSSGQNGLDGSKFPAFIRLNGYMTYDEKVNVKRFQIFYKDILPFYKDTTTTPAQSNSNDIYCSGNIKVACTATLGTLFPTLDNDVYNENVITVDVSEGI